MKRFRPADEITAARSESPIRSRLSSPPDLAEWVRAVNAGVTAAEEAAAEAEAAAGGTRNWFARTAASVNARYRLARALVRVEALTVGESRPSFVTRAAGE